MKRIFVTMFFACMLIGTMTNASNAGSQSCPPGYVYDPQTKTCVPQFTAY